MKLQIQFKKDFDIIVLWCCHSARNNDGNSSSSQYTTSESLTSWKGTRDLDRLRCKIWSDKKIAYIHLV